MSILSRIHLKKSSIRLLSCLLLAILILSSSLSVFATSSQGYITSFTNIFLNWEYANSYSFSGNTLTVNNSSSSGLTHCYLYGFKPDTTYSIYFFFKPADSASSSVSNLRFDRLSGYVVAGSSRFGTIDVLTHTFTNRNVFGSELYNYSIPINYSLDVETLCWCCQFTTNSTVTSTTLLYDLKSISSMAPFTIDFSKLYLEEGTIEDTLGNVLQSPIIGSNTGITIPAGYVAVFDRYFNGSPYSPLAHTVTLSTVMPYNSSLFGGGWETTVRYGFSSSLPSGWSDSTPVPWVKDGAGEWGLFGQTKDALCNISYDNTSRYFYIYNPLYAGLRDNINISNDIHISFREIGGSISSNYSGTYRLYKLDTQGLLLADTSIITDDPVDWEIETDSETGEVIREGWNGDPNYKPPVQNGGHVITSDNASGELINTIGGVVDAQNINASNLLSRVRSFFNKLGEFFSWLPAEIVAIIVPCIGIFFVVAVIKLFL